MRTKRASSLHVCGFALAIGLLVLAPGPLRAQYLEGPWAYTDLASGYGCFQGSGLPGDGASGYNFGAPGFSDGVMAPVASFESNPYFAMGSGPSGVETEVAEVSGYVSAGGSSTGVYQRSHYRPKVKTKVKRSK